jgi:hypothetical protein
VICLLVDNLDEQGIDKNSASSIFTVSYLSYTCTISQ